MKTPLSLIWYVLGNRLVLVSEDYTGSQYHNTQVTMVMDYVYKQQYLYL